MVYTYASLEESLRVFVENSVLRFRVRVRVRGISQRDQMTPSLPSLPTLHTWPARHTVMAVGGSSGTSDARVRAKARVGPRASCTLGSECVSCLSWGPPLGEAQTQARTQAQTQAQARVRPQERLHVRLRLRLGLLGFGLGLRLGLVFSLTLTLTLTLPLSLILTLHLSLKYL